MGAMSCTLAKSDFEKNQLQEALLLSKLLCDFSQIMQLFLVWLKSFGINHRLYMTKLDCK